ncbi:SRPBCC domain-containing protein [Streptomyces marokkonensis]|uniref:SRPBCC domain-containing protein n=1 Tax=Streptomyces marokkonensis TaxID=324855 RepID=UPI0011F128BD|nr:SRPBCC domain-containing protein [Streptomyces marokkonensis]
MEHEVFVPVAVERLREVLDDPARVARAVPGLQHDAGADPVAGRLKVRVGSHSVTYRGAVRVAARDDGSYAVDGDAAETRGSGAVKLALRLRLRPAEAGTDLVVTGTATAGGRVTELPAEAVAAAVTRLLNRFAENLGAVAEEAPGPDSGSGAADGAPDGPEPDGGQRPPEPPAGPESPELLSTGDFEPRATTDFETTPDADDAPPSTPTPTPDESARSAGDTAPPAPAPAPDETTPDAGDAARSTAAPDESARSAGDAARSTPTPDESARSAGEAPPSTPAPDESARSAGDAARSTPAPDGTTPDAGDAAPDASAPASGDIAPASDADASAPAPGAAGDASGFGAERPPAPEDEEDSVAEAAHARRTMIGRSAEEVDHAPPRGRYAPVPAPQTVSSGTPLRWAAPAAALAVASAVVAIRALRRRH